MDIFEELWIGKHQELIDKLNKGHAVRFKNQRDHWEFIFQKDDGKD